MDERPIPGLSVSRNPRIAPKNAASVDGEGKTELSHLDVKTMVHIATFD